MTLNIWGVGRNYANHAKEMNAPVPIEPLIFLKSGACMSDSADILLPKFSQDIHHEAELAVRIGQNLKPTHLTLALDLTARDLQAKAKSAGQPWTLSKSFIQSCPVGPWTLLPPTGLKGLKFHLKVNGALRQTGNANDMIFSIDAILAYLISHFPVMPGDVILTGTPEGVGPVRSGDILEGEIEGILNTRWKAMTPNV